MKSRNRKVGQEKAAGLQAVPVAGSPCSQSFDQVLRQSFSRLHGNFSLTQLLSWATRRNSPDSNSSVSRGTMRAWKWISRTYRFSTAKRLRVAETVSLGEKQFVAILNVDGCDFLIGGGASGIALLAHMQKPIEHSADVLEMVKASAQ